MERLASILLGLESEFYSKAKINEKSQINLVVFSFVLVLLFCFISMFVIGLFVSGMIPVAVIISCLGTFVFVSIFRFSLTLIKPEGGVIQLDVKIEADFDSIPENYQEVFMNIMCAKYLQTVSFGDNPFSQCIPLPTKRWYQFWKK